MTQSQPPWTAYNKVKFANTYIHTLVYIRFLTIIMSTVCVGYVLCPAEQRFMLLYTFLKKNIGKKVMVSRFPPVTVLCMYMCV